jgi:glycosyltransferase involved in cell wall biosynthesis
MTTLLKTKSPALESFSSRPAQFEKRTLSVTHVVLSLEIGGLERVVADLAREGRNLGQTISVLCLERTGTLAKEVEALGTRVECLNKSPGVRLGLVRDIAAKLRELKPDVVHTHQVGALFYCSRAMRKSNVPILVHTEHGKHYSSRWRTRLLGRLAGRRADRFFCVSSDIALEVRCCHIVNPAKIVIVPNGIDVERFRPQPGDGLRAKLNIPTESPVIGAIGRLSEIKQQHILLRAFAQIATATPNARLLIVGDGPLRQELESLARTLGVAPRVHFVGYQPQPEKFLAIMDIFALTSRSEGMPLSVLEAWAAGVPVIASAVGGLPELIGAGGAGVLFPSGDVLALAARLRELFSSPQARAELARRGSKVVRESYSASRMSEEYHRHYLSLLNETPYARSGHN